MRIKIIETPIPFWFEVLVSEKPDHTAGDDDERLGQLFPNDDREQTEDASHNRQPVADRMEFGQRNRTAEAERAESQEVEDEVPLRRLGAIVVGTHRK
jgi:hypothetical protein